MATTVTLTQKGEASEGTFTTLSAIALIITVPTERKTKDTALYFRIIAGRNSFEVGATWICTSRTTGEEFIPITLSAPEFGAIYGNIAPSPGSDDTAEKVIIWNPVN